MSERGRDWRTMLLAVGGVSGAFVAVLLAAMLAFYSALSPTGINLRGAAVSPLDAFLPAVAVLFMGALALPCAYYSIGYLAGAPSRPSLLPHLGVWQALASITLWVASALLAGYLVDKRPWLWLTPGLYLIAVAIPVYLLVRLIAGGLSAGSIRRFWGILCTGMVAGPTLAIFLELGLALMIALAVVLYFAVSPDRLAALQQLALRLSAATNMDQTFNVLRPLIERPITLVLALLFFSGFAPLVEEAAKSIAVWFVFDRLSTPAQGFLAGALSGAGFGLLESLLASASPDPNWSFTLLIRGGSSMMHIAAASLTGWGIASFRLTRRYGSLLGGYAIAVLLHSLWNASIVTITYGGLQMAFNDARPQFGIIALIALGAFILIVLCIGMPIALARINARFRGLGQATSPASFPTGSLPGQPDSTLGSQAGR